MLSIAAIFSAVIPTAPATPEGAIDFTWLFMKMLLVLGIVSVFAVLLIKYAVPKISFLKAMGPSRFFAVKARQDIGPGRSILIVQIGKRYLLIGATDHAINLITEMSSAEFEELNKT